MSPDPRDEMHLLVQADVDGELPASEAARVAAHLDASPDGARVQAELVALSRRLKQHAPRRVAPDLLRDAVRARLASPQAEQRAEHRAEHRAGRQTGRRAGLRGWVAGGISAGVAIAASLALFAMLPRDSTMPDWIAAAHIRALQPGHLIDVPSSDQHTVKPWFAGRLPFSPPVKDLSADDFALSGGRVDALPGSTAAVLVYTRRQHVIDLFIWPSLVNEDKAGGSGVRDGYNFVHWQADGMSFWAVSDINPKELADFAARWR